MGRSPCCGELNANDGALADLVAAWSTPGTSSICPAIELINDPSELETLERAERVVTKYLEHAINVVGDTRSEYSNVACTQCSATSDRN